MTKQTDLMPVFNRLKQILLQAPDSARVTVDDAGNYSLNTPYSTRYKKELFLAAVQIKKNYVSYHLMPVYMHPELLEGISPPLKKRMQGKSCFNFTNHRRRAIPGAGKPDLAEHHLDETGRRPGVNCPQSGFWYPERITAPTAVLIIARNGCIPVKYSVKYKWRTNNRNGRLVQHCKNNGRRLFGAVRP